MNDQVFEQDPSLHPLSVRLLSTHLSVGLATCVVARVLLELDPAYDATQHRETAEHAFGHASALSDRLGLSYAEIDQMTARLERLRFEVCSLA